MSERNRPTLQCLRVARKLQSYLDGVADEATSNRIEQHLEACRRCGLEAATYRALKQSLAERREPTADAVRRLRQFGEGLLEGADTNQDPEANRGCEARHER